PLHSTHTYLSPLSPPPRSPLFPYTTLFRSRALPEHGPELYRRQALHRRAARGRGVRGPLPRRDRRPARRRPARAGHAGRAARPRDRKSTRLNSSHLVISYAVFCLKKKIKENVAIPIHLEISSFPAAQVLKPHL